MMKRAFIFQVLSCCGTDGLAFHWQGQASLHCSMPRRRTLI